MRVARPWLMCNTVFFSQINFNLCEFHLFSAVDDPPVNYNRNNNQQLYADAYPDRTPMAATSSNQEYPIPNRFQHTSTASNKV